MYGSPETTHPVICRIFKKGNGLLSQHTGTRSCPAVRHCRFVRTHYARAACADPIRASLGRRVSVIKKITILGFPCPLLCLRSFHLMKIKPYQPLLALLFVSGLLQAQTTIPAGGPGNPATLTAPLTVEGDTTIEGTLTVKLPDAPPVSVGTPPVASLPIGNDKNTGFTDPATMGTSPDPDLSGNAIDT